MQWSNGRRIYYGLPVHTANAEFKDWVLKDGYQEMKILNEKHQTIPLLYKERIFEDREKQFVYYHELQARQQRLAGSLPESVPD